MAKLGNFQMRGFTGWATEITKANHLGTLLGSQPQKTGIMVRLLAINYGQTLDTFLSQYPPRTFDTDDEYTWDIIGSSRRNIPLVEARDEDGNTMAATSLNMIGANTAPFELVFAEDWFFDGEVLSGNLNEVYPMRILGPARMEGTNAVYKVELMGGNTAGIPKERLLAGEKFSVEYAVILNVTCLSYFYLANHRAILTVYMQCDVAVTSGGSCDVEAFCTFFEIHTAKFDELAVVDVEDIHIALTR